MSESTADNLTARPPWALMVAVFAVAMAVLGLEVTLTRAFSVLLRFHFVFLALSLATCGLGLGGLLDFLMRRGPWRTAAPQTVLIGLGSACALLMPLGFALLFASPLSAHLTSVWVVSAICLPPFVAAGAFLSHAFAWYSAQCGRLYFADLTGAALGSILVIAALQLLGGINAGLAWGVVVGLGTVLLGVGTGRVRLAAIPAVLTAATVALIVMNRAGGVVDLPLLPLRDDPHAKPLFQELGDPRIGAQIVDTEWNAFARTDVVSNEGVEDLFIYTDGEVPSNMIPFDGDLSKIVPRLTTFIGFFAFEQLRPDSVLLIGPGGGLDILLALAVDVKRIEGVELNPSVPRLVRKYTDFAGHVYDIEGVNVRVDEGRSYVSRTTDRYDMIYMALTKTATTATSSLALVESYIHTTEAFEEYFKHLTDRGTVVFVAQNPLILLRTMLTAVAALENLGVPRQEAFNHLALLSVPPARMVEGPYRYMLIAGKEALSPEQSGDLATHTIARGLIPIFFPRAFEPAPFTMFTRQGATDAEFVAWWNDWYGLHSGREVDFSPCDDNRPFVVDMSVGIPPQFSRFLQLAVGLMVALTVCVIAWMRRTAPQEFPGVGQLGGAALFFSMLGVGFMMVEVVLAQRLVLYLGYPVLTLSVILFSLLLGGGAGSLWSQSWKAGPGLPLRVAVAALVVALATLAVYWLHPLVVHATLAWDIHIRCAIAMAMMLPLGFAMGTPFPTGVRIVGQWARDLVPWMWGLNGITSVVGSVGAMSLAKLYGFGSVLFIGTAIYGVAAAAAFVYWLTIRGRTEQ